MIPFHDTVYQVMVLYIAIDKISGNVPDIKFAGYLASGYTPNLKTGYQISGQITGYCWILDNPPDT